MTIRAADLFCGAGGTSQGLVEAASAAGHKLELTAINHWERAVETHSANHPEARHLCASLDALNPRQLYRDGELDLLWASPECTHHSIARGGKPINDQSRATAWCVIRWAEALRPRVIMVENVKEFATWGPVGPNGRPVTRKKGEIFRAWIKALEAIGYRVAWKVLCAADYGDPTIRRRLFVRATLKPGIAWPSPTHSQEPEMFGAQQWRSAREIIDWSDRGTSIYDRKRPLAEKTMRRIMIGLEKFGLAPFIVPQQAGGRPIHSTDEPVATITTTSTGIGLAQPFLIKLRGTSTAASIDTPTPTITAGGGHLALIQPYLVSTCHGTENGAGSDSSRTRPITQPLPTVAGNRGEWAVAQPYLVEFYGTGTARKIDDPLPTVTAHDRFGLAQPTVKIDGDTYRIDILFRMLKTGELALAQGFPKGYRFTGTKTDIVKQIGNAVPCGLARALGAEAIEHIRL